MFSILNFLLWISGVVMLIVGISNLWPSHCWFGVIAISAGIGIYYAEKK